MNRTCDQAQTGTASRREDMLNKIERTTELPLLILAFAMVPLLAAPIFWDLSPRSEAVVLALDALIWALFATDLAVKLAIAPDRVQYARRHWLEVVIVLLPFVRPLRILWILRYGSRAYRGVVRLIRADFLAVYAVGLVLLVSTTITFLERERNSGLDTFSDALWWAVVTVTAVGYGDIVPETQAGRALAYLLMIGGIGLFGALTANFASFLVRKDQLESPVLDSLVEEVQALRDQLTRLEGQD